MNLFYYYDDLFKWVKSIQTAGYNGACTVYIFSFVYFLVRNFDREEYGSVDA